MLMKDKEEKEQEQAKRNSRPCFWSDTYDRREGRKKYFVARASDCSDLRESLSQTRSEAQSEDCPLRSSMLKQKWPSSSISVMPSHWLGLGFGMSAGADPNCATAYGSLLSSQQFSLEGRSGWHTWIIATSCLFVFYFLHVDLFFATKIVLSSHGGSKYKILSPMFQKELSVPNCNLQRL